MGGGLQGSALAPTLLDVMALQKVLSAGMSHRSLAWGVVEVWIHILILLKIARTIC